MVRTAPYKLPVGDLIGQTFSVYFRSFVPFVLLAAMVMVPWIVLRVSTEGSLDPALTAITGIVQTILGWVLTGAVTYGVVQQMSGKPAPFSELLRVGLQSILRVFVTGLVVGILVGLGTLAFVIPGIILTVVWFVAVPAAVIERLGVGAAMSRSAELTRGSRWQVFFGALFLGIVLIGVTGIGLFLLAGGFEGDTPIWFDIAIALVLTPFSAVMYSVCYVLLRQGKESLDVQQLAAVFD